MTLGEREQFTQLEETFTDDFVLGDVNLDYNFGDLALTSITSYTYRDILVVRDATALTASITGGSIGLPENVYTLDAPLDDATTAKVWTQELRVSGGKDRFPWVAGGFFSHTDRDYGQNLPVAGFEDLTRHPHARAPRPQGRPVLLRPRLRPQSVRPLRRRDAVADRAVQPDGAACATTTSTRTRSRSSTASSRNDNTGTSLVSQPGSTDANGVAPRLIATYKLSGDTPT